jgi:hypothetical protein
MFINYHPPCHALSSHCCSHPLLIHGHSAANWISRRQNNVLFNFFAVITYAMQAQVIHNVVVEEKKRLRSNNDSWRSSQYSAAQSVAEKGVKKRHSLQNPKQRQEQTGDSFFLRIRLGTLNPPAHDANIPTYSLTKRPDWHASPGP